MKVITRIEKAREAAAKWKQQYRTGSPIYDRLIALGPNPTPEQVDQTIGNTSWTEIKCDECKQLVETVVHLGDEPDYESNTVYICPSCLTKAQELL